MNEDLSVVQSQGQGSAVGLKSSRHLGKYSGNFNTKHASLPNASEMPANFKRSSPRDFTKNLNRIQLHPLNKKKKSFIATNLPVLSPKSGFIAIPDPTQSEQLYLKAYRKKNRSIIKTVEANQTPSKISEINVFNMYTQGTMQSPQASLFTKTSGSQNNSNYILEVRSD